MTKDEAIEIMQILYATYPNFNKNDVKGFNAIWLKRLMADGDYPKTLRKTEDYTAESKFAPTLADILVKEYKPRDDGMAEQIRAAEERVRQEKADPEKAARRERLLNEMRKKLGAYYDD